MKSYAEVDMVEAIRAYEEATNWCAARGYKPCGMNADYCIPAWELPNKDILLDNEDGRFSVVEDYRLLPEEHPVERGLRFHGPWDYVRRYLEDIL